MHRGELRAVGTPTKLKAEVSKVLPHATLEDVFRHYAASELEEALEEAESSSIREIRSTRKVARRVS
jgi:ABC-2 type transport system ATP-binding protein